MSVNECGLVIDPDCMPPILKGPAAKRNGKKRPTPSLFLRIPSMLVVDYYGCGKVRVVSIVDY